MLMFGFFIKFQPDNLTEKSGEILLEFFNVLLKALSCSYRFPKKLSTVKNHSKVTLFLLKDVEEYLICTGCQTHFLWKKKTAVVNPAPPTDCPSCEGMSLFKNEARTISTRSFFYRSIIGAIQSLFFRPGFDHMLKAQHRRQGVPGYLGDIGDGDVWNTFRLAPDQPVFTKESHRNLMLSINVDWLQPMEHTTHSTGAVYITIQNIPREYRMLMSNCILVEILTGPDEPDKEAIRFYFQRLTEELIELMDGIDMYVFDKKDKQLVKAALTQIASDLPASRKLIGMTGHSAGEACHRCDVNFNELDKKFGVESLEGITQRSMAEHKINAKKWLLEPVKSRREDIAKATGCRYSPLLELPYMDLHRFTTVDPMHGIFLVRIFPIFIYLFIFTVFTNIPFLIKRALLNALQSFGLEKALHSSLRAVPRC